MPVTSTRPFDQRLESWKHELSNAITSPSALLKELGLSDASPEQICDDLTFRCLVTPSYLKKIRKNDIDDPLLKQVLPVTEEQHGTGVLDPVGDLAAITGNGLLHKYHSRALLITTGACAIHCRYCFRRHYPYSEAGFKTAAMARVLDYLRQHPEIDEIILSGGDPLILDDARIDTLISNLETLPSLTSLRIHTRIPVVLPSRITTGLLTRLDKSRFRITMVIHSNHANELAEEESFVLKQLQQAGVTLLNQSVLLKGINDSVTVLSELSKRLHHCYTLPYYLHMLDPVQGAMHFDVPQQKATRLIAQLQSKLPGYLVPKLVREIAGNTSKTAIFSI